jgi:hypothetical protein
MTENQIELARHALGLPNKKRVSYRNHFCAGPGHTDYPEWVAMVAQGDAVRRSGGSLTFGGDDMFYVTGEGARAALLPREKLDADDFPFEKQEKKANAAY